MFTLLRVEEKVKEEEEEEQEGKEGRRYQWNSRLGLTGRGGFGLFDEE